MKQRMPLTKKLIAFSRVLSYLMSIMISLKTLVMNRIRPYRRNADSFLACKLDSRPFLEVELSEEGIDAVMHKGHRYKRQHEIAESGHSAFFVFVIDCFQNSENQFLSGSYECPFPFPISAHTI